MTDRAAGGTRATGDLAARGATPAALRWAWPVGLALGLLALHAWVIVGRPLYVRVMAHDMAIFVDAAHRVQSGQVPHLDFISGLGALCFYGPGLFGLADDPFRSFALFHVLAFGVVLACAVYAAVGRGLDGFESALLLVYLGAVVGAPSNLGEPAGAVSFAMWYNRLGWGLLLAGALLFLRPRRPGPATAAVDALLILGIGLAGFYLKITYAAVAAGLFGLGFVTAPHLRRPALAAAVGAVVVLLVVEAATGGMNLAYLRDLREVGAVNGATMLNPLRLLPATANLYEMIWVAAGVGLFWLIRPAEGAWRDLALFAVLIALAAYLYNSNIQPYGLPLLLAVFLIGRVRAREGGAERRAGRAGRHAPALFAVAALLFVGPEAVARYRSLALYHQLGRDAGYAFPAPEALRRGLIADEGTAAYLVRLANGEDPTRVLAERAEHLRRHPPIQELYQTEYAYTLARAAVLLDGIMARSGAGPVEVFDFANPLSSILGLPPPRGDYAWYHYGRNITDAHHRPAAEVLAEARYVLVPAFAANAGTRDLLTTIYGGYVREHYRLVADGPLWRVWARKTPGAGGRDGNGS